MAAQILAESFDVMLDFAIDNVEQTSAILAEHTFLEPLLREIARQTRNHFPNATLSIKISRDPIGVDKDQLAVYIRTSLSPQDALANLAEFDKAWWWDNQDRANGLISIDVAPR